MEECAFDPNASDSPPVPDFRELWDRFQRPLTFFVGSYLSRAPGTESPGIEDEVQEIMLKAHRSLASFDPTRSIAAPQRETFRELDRLVDALDPDDRAMLLLRYYEELTYAEIAAIVRRPEGTVKYRIHEIKHRLRDALGESSTMPRRSSMRSRF